jgi:predicted ATPase
MRGYELRAATTLARLLCEDGRKDEAQRLLAGVYGSFTEGLDTHDLREAQRVLGTLS